MQKCPVCKNSSYSSETLSVGGFNYIGISCAKCNTMITVVPLPWLTDIYDIVNATANSLQELKQKLDTIESEIGHIKHKMRSS